MCSAELFIQLSLSLIIDSVEVFSVLSPSYLDFRELFGDITHFFTVIEDCSKQIDMSTNNDINNSYLAINSNIATLCR